MHIFGGIDPGLTGALGVLDFKSYKLHLWDTPVNLVKVGDKVRKRCDVEAYRDALAMYDIDSVLIEKVQSTPNDGHVGAFTFGKVTGIAIGLCIGLEIEVDEETPAKWKHAMQVPADKEQSRHRASALFPQCSPLWTRAMDHGRAEAATIALYNAIKNGIAPERAFTIGLLNGEPYNPSRKRR